MKLGSQTGSVMNHLQSLEVIGQSKPFVGMGATILGWTDRHAGTITKVTELTASKKYQYLIEVVRDKSTLISGSAASESQVYSFEPGNGTPTTYRLPKDGLWEEIRLNPDTGRYKQTKCKGLRIGERDTYSDPTY